MGKYEETMFFWKMRANGTHAKSGIPHAKTGTGGGCFGGWCSGVALGRGPASEAFAGLSGQ